MVATEVKKLAQNTKTSLDSINASIGSMESSLTSHGGAIESTRGQLMKTQVSQGEIVKHVEETLGNLQIITGTLSDLEAFVRDRAAC